MSRWRHDVSRQLRRADAGHRRPRLAAAPLGRRNEEIPRSRRCITTRRSGAIALTPDGRKVITGRRAGRLHIWDAETERGFDLPPQGTEVTSLAVSPDGRVLASGTEGGVVRLWDTSLLGPIGQTCKFAGAVTALAFDPDGRVLAIGGEDGTIRLWEVPRQKALGFPLRVDHPVQTVTFGDGGRRLLIGTTEGARWWDLAGRVACESDRGRDDRLNDGRRAGSRPRRSAPTVGPWRPRSRDACGGRKSRPRRAPGCGHGKASPADARSAPRDLRRGLQPRLEMAPDLGSRAADGPALGRGHLATTPARSFGPWIPPSTRPSSAATAGRLLLGCRDGRARLWDLDGDVEIDSEHRPAMPTRSPPSPSIPNARGW